MASETMLEEYDFSDGEKNPYSDKIGTPVTIRLNKKTIEYFRKLSEEDGRPCETLISSYLTNCAERGLRPNSIEK